MRDKKKGNRILICGIALSTCLFVLAGGVILHLSETFIRSGIADMAGWRSSRLRIVNLSRCMYTPESMRPREVIWRVWVCDVKSR